MRYKDWDISSNADGLVAILIAATVVIALI